MSRAGGLAVVAKYGEEHMRNIGKKGYRAMVEKHFGGDYAKANAWLAKKGQFAADQDLDSRIYSIVKDPGPHPAHDST